MAKEDKLVLAKPKLYKIQTTDVFDLCESEIFRNDDECLHIS